MKYIHVVCTLNFRDHVGKSRDHGYISSESEEETPQEKKLRLAKQYLKYIEAEGKHLKY